MTKSAKTGNVVSQAALDRYRKVKVAKAEKKAAKQQTAQEKPMEDFKWSEAAEIHLGMVATSKGLLGLVKTIAPMLSETLSSEDSTEQQKTRASALTNDLVKTTNSIKRFLTGTLSESGSVIESGIKNHGDNVIVGDIPAFYNVMDTLSNNGFSTLTELTEQMNNIQTGAQKLVQDSSLSNGSGE